MLNETRENLNESQRDGRACVACGLHEGSMVPTGELHGVTLFAHEGCLAAATTAIRRDVDVRLSESMLALRDHAEVLWDAITVAIGVLEGGGALDVATLRVVRDQILAAGYQPEITTAELAELHDSNLDELDAVITAEDDAERMRRDLAEKLGTLPGRTSIACSMWRAPRFIASLDRDAARALSDVLARRQELRTPPRTDAVPPETVDLRAWIEPGAEQVITWYPHARGELVAVDIDEDLASLAPIKAVMRTSSAGHLSELFTTPHNDDQLRAFRSCANGLEAMGDPCIVRLGDTLRVMVRNNHHAVIAWSASLRVRPLR